MTPATVRRLRAALGLQQAELAQAMGIAARETVSNWERDGSPKTITGPAARLLTYMAQGALDATMASALTEHAFAVTEAGAELVYRNHRPRFIAAVTDRPAGDDVIEVVPGEWLSVALWIDDPTAPPGWNVDDLLRRAATAWEVYTQDSAELAAP